MQLHRVRAISFDLDDTLWPFHACLHRAEAALLAWLRTHAPRTAPLLADSAALMRYRAQAELDFPELRADLSGLRRASIRALLIAAEEDPSMAEPAFEAFFEERLRVDLYPEVAEVLAGLARRLPLVALTNGNACIHKAGIGPHFKGIVSAATLGVGKPAPEAFQAAAALAGVDVSELLHVGDDWQLDVVGAVNAGAQAVWIVREEGRSRGVDPATALHLKVADLKALCRALGEQTLPVDGATGSRQSGV